MEGDSKPSKKAVALVVIFIVAAIVGGKAMYGHIAYGDASCGFKNCVEVK